MTVDVFQVVAEIPGVAVPSGPPAVTVVGAIPSVSLFVDVQPLGTTILPFTLPAILGGASG